MPSAPASSGSSSSSERRPSAPGCDGFVISATCVPGTYEDFVTFVVPELQRRGLFHMDYKGRNLRENLGLPRPEVGAWRNVRRG